MEGTQLSTGLCDCRCGSWPCLPLPIWNLSPHYFLPQRPMNWTKNKGLCGRRGKAREGRRGPLTSSEQPETKAQKVQAEGMLGWRDAGPSQEGENTTVEGEWIRCPKRFPSKKAWNPT